jgi:hypothetical protein
MTSKRYLVAAAEGPAQARLQQRSMGCDQTLHAVADCDTTQLPPNLTMRKGTREACCNAHAQLITQLAKQWILDLSR